MNTIICSHLLEGCLFLGDALFLLDLFSYGPLFFCSDGLPHIPIRRNVAPSGSLRFRGFLFFLSPRRAALLSWPPLFSSSCLVDAIFHGRSGASLRYKDGNYYLGRSTGLENRNNEERQTIKVEIRERKKAMSKVN